MTDHTQKTCTRNQGDPLCGCARCRPDAAVPLFDEAHVREYRTHGHLSLCEMLTGGDNPWCSCGYEKWLEENPAFEES